MGKQKIYFRADASERIGYGHYTRSLALAEMLKNDFDCVFFTQEPTADQQRQVESVCRLVPLPSDDTKFCIFLDMLSGDEIVFLDNYFFTSEYQRHIKERGCKLICLGTNDRHYYCDVLFNFAETDSSIFSIEPYTQVKLGLEWAILRKPFRESQVKRPGQPQHQIAICYGGTDQFHLTEITVEIIRRLPNSPDITLIATDRFGAERMGQLREQGVSCLTNATAEQMIETFRHCDCLICSSSTVAQEGLVCQIPVVCGYYVDNQRRMYDYLTNAHLVTGVDDMLSDDFPSRLTDVLTHPYNYQHDVRPFHYRGVEQRYRSLFENLCNR